MLTKRVLYKPAKAVDFDHPWQNQKLADDLIVRMRFHQGIGLAATQVGISLRVFVMEIGGWQWRCFNPQIDDQSPELGDWAEGCLSFPKEQCIIKRPIWVDVSYQDFQGTWHSERLADIRARCFQHELDHLSGITMHQRLEEQHAKQSGN